MSSLSKTFGALASTVWFAGHGQIVPIFRGAFGPRANPSPLLAALYQVSGLPD